MEMWDVYDKNRVKKGKTIVRGSHIEPDEFHMVIHICIINAKGELLIQQRQPFKNGWPNMWDITVGGSALAGENSQQAASRELMEEIGYEYDFTDQRPIMTVNFSKGFDDYYVLEEEVNLEDLTLQYEEVQAVKWATKEEVFDMIDEGKFIPYYKSLINTIFEMRRNFSSMKSKL